MCAARLPEGKRAAHIEELAKEPIEQAVSPRTASQPAVPRVQAPAFSGIQR